MTDKKYTIGIIGGGSVGLTYAALLADKANIIVKTRSKEQAEKIKTQGIDLTQRLKTPIDSKDKKETLIHGIDATTEIHDLSNCDAIIVTVKSYQTEDVAKELSARIKEDTEILTLQNGLQAFEILKRTIKNPERVFAGVTYIGATRTDERSVTVDYDLRTIIDAKAIIFGQVLQSSKFDFSSSDEIRQVVWDKLVLNTVQNPLGAITNLTFGEMGESQECLNIAEKLLGEFEQVAKAEGLSFHYSLIDKLKNTWKMSKHHPSMWQDLQKKKKTEIDAINGAISALGKKHNIATPYNDMITSLIKIIEVGPPQE